MNGRLLRFLTFVTASLFALICGCAPSGHHHKSIEPFTALDFSPPQAKSFSLSNGLKVYLLEDHELPLVSGALYIPGGSLWEKATEKGSTSAMGYMLRHGGAGARDPKTLDRDLEKLAATVSSSFGSEYGVISFSCLSADLEAVSNIFADVILKPRFDTARLDLLKLKSLEEIKRRRDDPVSVASLSFRQLLFGSSPYGLPVVSEEIRRINRKILIERYKTLVNPNRAIMAVTGNVDEEQLKTLLEEKLEPWASTDDKALSPPEAPKEGRQGIFFIELPFQQATVFMGELGQPRFTRDWFDILVFNEVFGEGGRFGSRLFQNVRSEKGLAYTIQGSVNPSIGRGVNSIIFQTKSESSAEAMIAAINVLKKMQSENVTSQELNEAKHSLINSFVFKFDTSNDIVQRKAGQELLGFPIDYDRTFLSRIKDVNTEALSQVARERWHPDLFTIVVVGDKRAYESISSLLKGPLNGYNMKRISFGEALLEE